MNDISYVKTIKKLYAADTSRFTDLLTSMEKMIDESKFRTREERGKAYILKTRDVIMGIYVR